MAKQHYFLGADVGSTRTRILITDECGRAVGYAAQGSGNPDVVQLSGFHDVLHHTCHQALTEAGLAIGQISGAGFGVSGYDWPSQREPMLQVIRSLGLACPFELVNDAIIGMIAGSREGWGIGLVSGTGCNCWGWDITRTRIGHVTGGGDGMGEAGGASELVNRAQQVVAWMWTRRGPKTCLADAFIQYTGATDLPGLLEGIMTGKYHLDAAAAPLIFQAARQGDLAAKEIVEWGGRELGEMACAVIRQLSFEALEFDLVLVGSTYEGGAGLVEQVSKTVHALAPGARFVRLNAPPVTGAVLLGMEQAGWIPGPEVRRNLETISLGKGQGIGLKPVGR